MINVEIKINAVRVLCVEMKLVHVFGDCMHELKMVILCHCTLHGIHND